MKTWGYLDCDKFCCSSWLVSWRETLWCDQRVCQCGVLYVISWWVCPSVRLATTSAQPLMSSAAVPRPLVSLWLQVPYVNWLLVSSTLYNWHFRNLLHTEIPNISTTTSTYCRLGLVVGQFLTKVCCYSFLGNSVITFLTCEQWKLSRWSATSWC